MPSRSGHHHHHHHRDPAVSVASLIRSLAPDDLFSVGLYVLLALAFVLGGASRENAVPAAIVQLYALALAPFAAYRLSRMDLTRQQVAPLALCALALLIPFLQLIPLPPALWSSLPGRDLARQTYEAAGMALPWLPISMTPALTFRAAMAVVPAVVIFMSALTLSPGDRRNALVVVLAAVLASAFVGALQVSLRTQGFYENIHTNLPIGFFANRNHAALLMLCVLPATAALIAVSRSHARGLAVPLLGGVVMLAAIVTLALLQSRAGVLLFLPAAGGAALVVWRSGLVRRSRLQAWMIAGGVAAGVALAVAVGLSAILLRFDTDPGQDLRFAAAPDVWKAALAHMPLGSGLGSFDAVYRSVERTPLLTPVFFNHAHNDYLELLLETGWLGVAALLAFLGWLLPAAWRAWKPSGSEASLAQAATVVVLLMLMHSTVDYPLRTLALSGLFALACALFATPPPAGAPARASSARSRRRSPSSAAGVEADNVA